VAQVISNDADLADAVVETSVPNLFVLPCGEVPKNPAELLTSQKFVELLAVLRDRYDRIILDTPPLLAVADPCIVAANVDGVVLTVRLTRDSRMQVMRSKELLEGSKGNLVGVVINGHDLTRRHKLAGYGYGYGYGYGGYGYGSRYGYYGTYGAENDSAGGYYREDDEENESHAENGSHARNGHSGPPAAK
jgi:capsular exopolysaccharide synthesis family protein